MAQEATKNLWSKSLPKEENYWAQVISGENPKFSKSFKDRATGRWPFSPHIERYVNVSGLTRILDVGAGPVTFIGNEGKPANVEIVAIDPLADFYNQKLDEYGVCPWLRTRQGEAERLQEYGLGLFDIVYCRNALDHGYDPMRAIEAMLGVVKKTGIVFLLGSVNEGEKQRYRGLHQWNFLPAEDGDLIIWRPDQRVSVRNSLKGKATVSASGENWYYVHIKPT